MTDAWSTDLTAGHDTGLLAWRRQDVADLNRLERERWDELGRLPGDDVKVGGGRSYASGDRLVALAPNPQAEIVTSEPLTAVEVDRDSMVVRTAVGREVTITGEGLDSDHLDYGYALTIHRSQGATYDRSHVLAAGGGRELGYVAMSRARDGTMTRAPSRHQGHPTARGHCRGRPAELDEHSAPEEHQLERQAAAARREVAKLPPAANAEHLERLQATARAAGLDRGIGL